jgi:hypothetical protein
MSVITFVLPIALAGTPSVLVSIGLQEHVFLAFQGTNTLSMGIHAIVSFRLATAFRGLFDTLLGQEGLPHVHQRLIRRKRSQIVSLWQTAGKQAILFIVVNTPFCVVPGLWSKVGYTVPIVMAAWGSLVIKQAQANRKAEVTDGDSTQNGETSRWATTLPTSKEDFTSVQSKPPRPLEKAATIITIRDAPIKAMTESDDESQDSGDEIGAVGRSDSIRPLSSSLEGTEGDLPAAAKDDTSPSQALVRRLIPNPAVNTGAGAMRRSAISVARDMTKVAPSVLLPLAKRRSSSFMLRHAAAASVYDKEVTPMKVVELATFLQASSIPRSSEGKTRVRNPADVVVFVSHRWWSKDDPDDSSYPYKHSLLCRALRRLVQQESLIKAHVVVW